MKKRFIAAVAAAALMLSMGAMGVSASTNSTACDGYSCFTWNKSGNNGTVALQNTDGSSHYLQVYMVGYSADGATLNSASDHGVYKNTETCSKSNVDLSKDKINVSSMKFTGQMYSAQNAHGPLLSSWVKSSG